MPRPRPKPRAQVGVLDVRSTIVCRQAWNYDKKKRREGFVEVEEADMPADAAAFVRSGQ